jgi:cytochrome c peroxidase
MIKTLSIFALTLIILVGISIFDKTVSSNEWKRPTVNYPEGNPDSEASVELGSTLFFETLLSRDSSISCQSCHLITEAFADHLPLGEGIKGRTVTRNTPSLLNIGFQPYFMADGKFGSLEEQVLGPIHEHREFDMTEAEVVERLKDIPMYHELSLAAYNQEINIAIIQKALANFQRALISDNSRFDQFMRRETKLSKEEMMGWKLFNSPGLNCIQCHGGYNFTNYSFENNGLYSNYTDSGRALITKHENDLAKFKVPSLRNVAITHPYMHDGSFHSLEEIIDHYASGGKGHISQSDLVKGFDIQAHEKEALIAFLKALTEERYLE